MAKVAIQQKLYVQRTFDLCPLPTGLSVVFGRIYNLTTKGKIPWMGFIYRNGKTYFSVRGFGFILVLKLFFAKAEASE